MPIPHRRDIKRDLLSLLQEEALSPTDAYRTLSKRWQLTPSEMTERRGRGVLYEHEIRWARQELVLEGLIARPMKGRRGEWALTSVSKAYAISELEDGDLQEGQSHLYLATRVERNKLARKRCLAFHGYNCKACDLSMADVYGALAHESIHVHHIRPMSLSVEEHAVDPIQDMVPLCPNCHHIAHLRNVQKLRALSMDGHEWTAKSCRCAGVWYQ